ncbi:MAG TPA: hypothetical protein VJY34_10295 [Roseiarcus sp.]|nr:hypothetical protein [Roseiarcus sp.]
MPLADVGVLAKCGLGRGVVENDTLSGAQDVVEHRFRQRGRAHLLVAQLHNDRVAPGCRFRLYPLLDASRKNQQTSLGAGLLDRGAHERVDQLLEADCARDRLRHLDRRREIEVFDRRRNCAGRPERGLFRKRRLEPIGKRRVQLFDSAPRLQLRAQP